MSEILLRTQNLSINIKNGKEKLTAVDNISFHVKQGEILGINQSISSLAQALPPIIAGFVASVNINLPTWFAAGATLMAWIIFKSFFKED